MKAILVVVTLCVGLACRIEAQTDSATLHATNAEWVEKTWLRFLDRGAAIGGRLTQRGVLLRFHQNIDEEYWLDFVSASPGMTETYEWSQRRNGARYWGGSVNQLRTIGGGDFKMGVPLGRGWIVGTRFTLEDHEELTRALTRLEVEKTWSNGAYVFGGTTLLAHKPEIDASIGWGFRNTSIDGSVALTALDLFNDLIYEELVVFQGFADTAVAYGPFPWAVKGRVRWSPIPPIRIEGDAAYVISSSLRAFRQVAPDTGFSQSEDFGFVAILAEYSVSSDLRVGATYQLVSSRTDRTPLAPADSLVNYHLTERTLRMGAFALADLGNRWRVESWLMHERRAERRVDRSPAGASVNYEDRSWLGTAVLEYRPPGGFRAHGAFEMDLRDVVRGAGQVPARGAPDEHNVRLRFDVGWRFGAKFQTLVGYRIDLDGDRRYPGRGWFDGAHARFTMNW